MTVLNDSILNKLKKQILDEMKVLPNILAKVEVERRINFIKETLKKSQTKTLVLGISGGIDSTTAGRLCQCAIDQLNQERLMADQNQLNGNYQFIAVRLPYGTQNDEEDALSAIAFINPSQQLCINIDRSVDAIDDATHRALSKAKVIISNAINNDFVKGNVKARARMVAQYEVAGLTQGLVVGTDHSAENITGFYTKHGDGACDLAPLFGLNKRQIRLIAHYLGAPENLVSKVPTADLEEENPLLTDEEALGLSYDEIDDFLEGKPVNKQAEKRLITLYLRTQHKRQPILTLYS